MKTICRLLALIVLLGAVAAPPVADAKSRKNNKNHKNHKRPATRKGDASELPTVSSVGNGSITVGGKMYLVDEDTRITVNGNPAGLGAVKKGMQCLISGSVEDYGKTSRDTLYKATKITARNANKIKATNKNQGNRNKKR